MGLFSSILEKLGFGQQAEPSKPMPAPAPTSAPQAAPVEKPAVAAISAVDVVGKLEIWPHRTRRSSTGKRQLWICSSSSIWIAASRRERKSLRPNSDVPKRRWEILRR